MRGTEHGVVAGQRFFERCAIEHVEVDGLHVGAACQLVGSLAGDGRDGVAAAQGFFQKAAAGASGGADDGDVAHE